MAKQTKVSKTYRLPPDTIGLIEKLATFFNESGAEAVERAVNLLEREKEIEIKREYDQRMSQVKSAK
ncbi:hypothetical protein [Larkinella sp. C7]|uniref:hypothetical protein n=1 Tax=Larkinella sp. C7 TaxID=2576607 RepID=UPI0011113FFD|nr:hypothetical protein [Larkinella sp. C7]